MGGKKFVLGPYSNPPLDDFRANSMFAVIQNDKVRPIVNMSSPPGKSFNDAVVLLPKIEMSSSKQVMWVLIKCLVLIINVTLTNCVEHY